MYAHRLRRFGRWAATAVQNRLVVLGALTLLAAALQWPLWDWEVEDAAISLSYARNLVAGDGLVAQVGAERIEGFSDPSWVACLALTTWLGIDPFSACRWLGLLFGALTVPAVFVALRPFEREHPLAPIWGAAAVALFAPHAIWSQSGLENALFDFLLAAGCARLANGGDREWLGPLLFFGLAWTRPEGVAYAAVAGALAIAAGQSPARMATRTLCWSVAFGVPFLLSEGLALWYFAQELPATYHAKLGNSRLRPLDGNSRGWTQLLAFASDTWTVLFVPVMVVGASGAAWRRWIPAALSVLVLLVAWLITAPVPLIALFLALPLLALGRKLPIGIASSLLLVALAFHIGAGGDWMRGYRWLSLATVPGAMLVGVGIAELAERFEPLRIGAPVLAALFAVPQLVYLRTYDQNPEVAPPSVERRLRHWIEVGRRLHIEHRLRIVDHDMGGNLYYGGEIAEFRDAKGLVDLPFAFWGRERTVVAHELFEDRPFDFAHAHASTGVVTRPQPAFRQGYVEIEPYGRGHGGQFVRRSLIFDSGWDGPAVPVTFDGGVELLGLSVPSPEVGPGSGVFVELGLTAGRVPFRLVAFLSNATGVVTSWDLPPAYDWIPPGSWKADEVFHGRFSLPVLAGIPEGTYDLGLVVFGRDGAVWPAEAASWPAFLPEHPRFAEGEVRIPGQVRIVSTSEMGRLALVDRTAALDAAAAGNCEAAEASWTLALRHRTRSRDWRSANRPPVARALAQCLGTRAGSGNRTGDALLDRVREIEAGRLWAPREPTLLRSGAAIADEAHGRAVATDDPHLQFQWFEAAVRADPTRSWDRRWAERARGTWVGVDRARVDRRSTDPDPASDADPASEPESDPEPD